MKENTLKERLEEEKMNNPSQKEELKEKAISKEEGQQSKQNKNIEENEKNDQKEEKNQEKFRKSKNSNKKEMKKMEEEKKKRKWIIPVVIIGIIIILALLFSTVFALMNISNENMISGISIEGIEISGLSKEEAKAKLETIYNEKKQKDINLIYQDYETQLSPTIMEVNYDVEKAINEAYELGRSENIFINNYQILLTLISKKDINVEMSLNEDITKQSIQDIQANLPGVVIESTYAIEDDELIITKGKEGVAIDTDNLLNKVKERLDNTNIADENIEIPVVTQTPQEIDIQKIHDEIYKEPQDAYYTKDPFTLYPEVVGIDFDVEEAKKILQEDKEEYVIKLTLTQPKVTLTDIGTEAFPDKLSDFTTMYDPGDTDRSTNLRIACEKLNGKVIMPGETFSYNQTLGPRTVAAGYKNGKIYENGKVVDGIGGGICQISSTLYNAVLEANLEIVERRNHQFVTSYVGAGRDATVVYGLTDFRFKNTRQYPIRLVASSKNGIASVAIYGIKEETEYTFDFKTNTIGTIPYTTQYIEDSTLEAGTEIVEQKGANGIQTETYIIKKLNGKEVSRKLLSKDTYSAMTRIIRKGTKNSTTSTQTTTENEPAQSTDNTQDTTQNQEPTTPTEPTPTEPTTPETPSSTTGENEQTEETNGQSTEE